ncbi:MAG: SusC/RagA family TonB-linked outer membrane protein [Gemmatimonadetes bacterium]|nr:SusC/RagA family TonB-linked outer membrane protein [Gemmatimonadota bacterium]
MRNRFGLFAAILIVFGVGTTQAQTRVVTGKVTDSLTAEPLTSGQVSVVGTTIGTAIKEDGTFTLAAPARDVMLSVRSIGFKRRDVAVPASTNTAQVALERDYFQLEAIVVTGQATGVEKRNLANAVASITGDQVTKVPTSSVERALQGKVAGAQIMDVNGAPGGGNLVRIRGITSLIGAYTPLYVVNGVIVSDAIIARGTNTITRAGGTNIAQTNQANGVDDESNAINRIADLNPNDIESVEVLKGASASAIYGSKASNGVIIITTKKGRVGAPQFAVTQRFGQSRLSNKYGTRCFNDLAEATSVSRGFGPTNGASFVPGVCHDFEEELFGRPALHYETSGSMSGGTENTRYYASLLNKHEGGIVPRSFANKQALTMNIDQNIGSRLQLSISSQTMHTQDDRGLTGNENNSSTLQSSYYGIPSWIDWRGTCPDGSRVENPGKPCKGATFAYASPYVNSNAFQTVALMQDRESVWREIGSAKVQLDVLNTAKHTLRFISVGGGDVFTQKNAVHAPPELQFEQGSGVPGTNVLSFSQSQQFNVNSNLVYTLKTSAFSATTQAGIQFESSDLDIGRVQARNVISGLFNIDKGTVTMTDHSRQRVRDVGYFAQEEFLTLGEKLLLTIGGRADQSSNNSDASKLYFYPKSSISYRIPNIGPVNELKLRAAYGNSGNRPFYGQKFTELNSANIGGVPTDRVSGTTADPDLHPEREREIEGGFDATLLGSRANVEFTVYDKKVSEVLLQRALAPSMGFSTLIFNGAAMRTRGLEAQLNLVPVQTAEFQWNPRFGFHMHRCNVLDLAGLPPFRPTSRHNSATSGHTWLAPDSSCTQIYARDTLGALGMNDTVAPDGTTQPLGTRVTRKIGDQQPRYNFTVANDVSWKRFKLYFLWEHQKGGLFVNFTLTSYDSFHSSPDFLTPRFAGDTVGAGRARINAFNRGTARAHLLDATFWKMRDLTLSYDLPPSLTRKLWSGARYVRASISGRNLITISDYQGYDPEGELVARSLAQGSQWELWVYPPSRQVFFSVDVGF